MRLMRDMVSILDRITTQIKTPETGRGSDDESLNYSPIMIRIRSENL